MIVRWLFGEAHDRQVELARAEIAKATRVDAEDRSEKWDACWHQVQEEYLAGKNPDLTPPYLRQTVARIGGAYAIVKPEFFPAFQRQLVMALARKHFPRDVVEIGCGAGFNLLNLSRCFQVRGYDRSQAAVHAATAAGLSARLCGDLRTDCSRLDLPPGAGILTCGAMEQLGPMRWGPLFGRLLQHDGPILHIEPIEELYDGDAADKLARGYHEARGYLAGYYSELRRNTDVQILKKRRLRIGTAWNDGFSYVVWRRA